MRDSYVIIADRGQDKINHAYSRIRYASGGDYVRTDIQRTILNLIFLNNLGLS